MSYLAEPYAYAGSPYATAYGSAPPPGQYSADPALGHGPMVYNIGTLPGDVGAYSSPAPAYSTYGAYGAYDPLSAYSPYTVQAEPPPGGTYALHGGLTAPGALASPYLHLAAPDYLPATTQPAPEYLPYAAHAADYASVPIAASAEPATGAAPGTTPVTYAGYSTQHAVPSAPSILVTPPQPAAAPTHNLQSAVSMITYPGMQQYPSAMDGPFKFYANPPGNQPSPDLGVEHSSAPSVRQDSDQASKPPVRKYASSKKKTCYCC